MSGVIVRPGQQKFAAEVVDGWTTDRWGHRVPVLGDRYWETIPCNEDNCGKFVTGFRTILDETREDMHDAAEWIRHESGLAFSEAKDVEGLTTFSFPPGQQCFEGRKGGHKEPTGRPGKLMRVTTEGVYTFQKPEDFNECFNEEQDANSRAAQRG